MKKTIKLSVVAVLLAALTLTTGCSKKNDTSSKVKKLYIGTGNSYKPYCYLDENGKLAGYEYEVLKAIDELLPQYEFEYETTQFPSLFSSLAQDKYDAIAHQIEYNEDRYANYEFSKETYTTFITYITVPQSVNGISSLDDLQGKVAYVPAGDNALWYLEDYNKNHPGKEIRLDIASLSTDEIVAGLANGRWNFTVRTKRDVESLNSQYNAGLKIVGEPIQKSSTYYLFKKGNTKLRDEFDGAVRTLKENGKLRDISIAVIGGDYTESE